LSSIHGALKRPRAETKALGRGPVFPALADIFAALVAIGCQLTTEL
jgi:hypothetical protein